MSERKVSLENTVTKHLNFNKEMKPTVRISKFRSTSKTNATGKCTWWVVLGWVPKSASRVGSG